MARQRGGYTIVQLADRTGVLVRTLRSWIAKKVLPGPTGTGRGARYTERHLLLARAIFALRKQSVPLSKMRAELSKRSPDELAALAASHKPARRIGPPDGDVPPPPPPPDYPRSPFEIVTLADGLWLLVKPDATPWHQRMVAEIYRHYGPDARKSGRP